MNAISEKNKFVKLVKSRAANMTIDIFFRRLIIYLTGVLKISRYLEHPEISALEF